MPGEHTHILGVRSCQALPRSVSPTRLCSLALILLAGVLQPEYAVGLRPDSGGAGGVDPHAIDNGGSSIAGGSSEDSSSSSSARVLHASGAGEEEDGLGGSHGRETLAYQLGNHEVQKDPDTGCPLPVVDMSRDRYGCVEWWKVCIDQDHVVYYDERYHPKHSILDLPTVNTTDIMYNLPSKYGIGDRYRKGSALRFPQLYVRPANDMEEEPELQGEPKFSRCTLPLLLYAHYPFNAAETYRYIYEKLVMLQEAGFFNRYVTMVPGVPPGTRVPSYTKFWYGSLTERAVVSLSELSSRLGPDTPSNATWEGRHVRCFERMVVCKIRYDRYGLLFYRAGQHVVKHYMPSLLARSAEFEQKLYDERKVRIPSDPSVLKVVIIARNPDHSAVGRTILNEQELIDQCNSAGPEDLPPATWHVPYKSYFCFAHTFGGDQLMDVWIMRRVDAILGMHGAGLTNALYMKPGGSAIEVRPLGFSGREAWANRYMRFKASSPSEKPWRVFWYGIDTFNASNSEPGAFESEDREHYSRFRVIKARDRHVLVPWPVLRHHLLNVAAAARTHDRYMSLRYSGAFYVTDSLEQAEAPGADALVEAARQRNFTDANTERNLAVQTYSMDAAAIQEAAQPDALRA